MSALTTGLGGREEASWGRMTFLLSAVKVFQGSRLGMILKGANAGKVTKYTATADLFLLGCAYLGQANASIDATSADKAVQIDLLPELVGLEWMPQGATPVAAANVLQNCYFADDNTVVPGSADLGTSAAGRVLAVDSIKGVLVAPPLLYAPVRKIITPGPTLAFASNDIPLTQVVQDATYAVPTTGAASTITLPDATNLPDGHGAEFFADGTLNGHAITYRDGGTANAAILAALTASKRHLVRLSVRTGKWVSEGCQPGA